MKHRVQTCTWGKWCVSTTTSPRYGGEGATLTVFIPRGRKYQYGDGNDRWFSSSDAAFAWALEHGYCQRWYRTAASRALNKRLHKHLEKKGDFQCITNLR